MIDIEKRKELLARARAAAEDRVLRVSTNDEFIKKRFEAADASFRQHKESENHVLLSKRRAMENQRRRQITAQRKLTALISDHISLLLIQYRACCSVDEYRRQIFNERRWLGHVERFFECVVAEHIADAKLDSDTISFVTNLIREKLASSTPTQDVRTGVHSGVDYEKYCGDILREAGWRVTFTPVSGDQGVDLIAGRNEVSVAIQCKWYSSPVGNAAVQEAFAGAAFAGASHAAVVTNAGYTKSARTLAASTGVLLLNENDLRGLEKKLLDNR